MIQDLHSHTVYSYCSTNPTTEEGVLAAIEGGVRLFGVCDHNYGIGYLSRESFIENLPPSNLVYQERINAYYDTMSALKEKYREKIAILRGIELATTLPEKGYPLPDGVDVSFFDYCLIEHLDNEDSVTGGDLFSYAKKIGCPAGIAHTDMFAFIEKTGKNPLDYFHRMAEENIFWEMNVNYDSVHRYREHEYMKRFFNDEKQQEIIRKSGVKLSVGFDGHFAAEYAPDRVIAANERLRALQIPLAFDVINK